MEADKEIVLGTKVLIKNWNEEGIVSNLSPKGDMVEDGFFEVTTTTGRTLRSKKEVIIIYPMIESVEL